MLNSRVDQGHYPAELMASRDGNDGPWSFHSAYATQAPKNGN